MRRRWGKRFWDELQWKSNQMKVKGKVREEWERRIGVWMNEETEEMHLDIMVKKWESQKPPVLYKVYVYILFPFFFHTHVVEFGLGFGWNSTWIKKKGKHARDWSEWEFEIGKAFA